jgi:transcriptional regulator with XRE-family HTH domain
MNTEEATARIPAWDTADRMRKALRDSGIGVQEIADYLGVSRGAVGTWINGRVVPSTQTLRLWAIRCAVSFEWLTGGDIRTPGFFRSLAVAA